MLPELIARKALGGHDVPEVKIRSRYIKALKLLPNLIDICDICHIYDNTQEPFRIFKKRKNIYFYWENKYWKKSDIIKLTGIADLLSLAANPDGNI